MLLLIIVNRNSLGTVPWLTIVERCHPGDVKKGSRIVACSAVCPASLGCLYFSNPRFPGLSFKMLWCRNTQPLVTCSTWWWRLHTALGSIKRWVVLMGGAINHPLIRALSSISACFLTAQTYKCMHLTTWVYGIWLWVTTNSTTLLCMWFSTQMTV